jgi:formate/nitrite transporter FocA (FNT family)
MRRSQNDRRDEEQPPSGSGPANISDQEADDVEEMSSPRTPVIYEIVRKLGDEEMDRPAISLWWSGLAAGLSISFSLLSQTVLDAHLPQASWSPLVSSLGYSVGFVIVVLSRQQLFTESTVTQIHFLRM